MNLSCKQPMTVYKAKTNTQHTSVYDAVDVFNACSLSEISRLNATTVVSSCSTRSCSDLSCCEEFVCSCCSWIVLASNNYIQHSTTLCLKKMPFFCFQNNSVKREPISIIFGTRSLEETLHQKVVHLSTLTLTFQTKTMMSFVGHPKVIPYTNFEHFWVIRF